MLNFKKLNLFRILIVILLIFSSLIILDFVSAENLTDIDSDSVNSNSGFDDYMVIDSAYEGSVSGFNYDNSLAIDSESNMDLNNNNSLIKSPNDSLKDSSEEIPQNVYYVSLDGSDSNNGKSINAPFNSLKKALDADYTGFKIIYLVSGNYTSLNNSNLTLKNGENVSIIASTQGNSVLDANSLNRFFTVSKNSSLTLINLTFVNGFDSNNGGAILNHGNLTLINCSFSDNEVSSGDTLNRDYSVYGGAIYSDGALYVFNSSFSENRLGSKYQLFSYGGAIYSKGSLLVNNSRFESNILNAYLDSIRTLNNEYNASMRGGAIYAIGDNIEISNSGFVSHELFAYYKLHDQYPNFNILSEGGALFIEGNNVKISGCSFYENHADAGGAVSFFGNNFTFINSRFSNNSAYTGAGVFSIDFIFNGKNGFDVLPSYTNTKSDVLVENCDFDGNYLYTDIGSGNFRYYRGGGALLLKLDNISIINSTFSENGAFETIDSVESSYCFGGAVYSMGDNSHYHNCSFTNNMAHLGGAIADRGINTTITDSGFEYNRAIIGEGGALFHQRGDNMLINNSCFNSNNASCGGAVYSIARYYIDESYNNHYSIYENSRFINNSAEYGGGIYDNGDYITYLNLTFRDNSANYGGAIYNQGLANRFDKSTFINNRAIDADYSNGGAIYNNGHNTDYFDCVFTDNHGDNLGGAIYNSGNDIYCINSSFNNNSAFKGGSIYLRGSNGKIQSNNLSDSFAVYGGAIYNEGTEMIISLNRFTRNLANFTGGGIYNLGESLVLSGNQMFNCSSAIFGQGYGDCIYTQATISYLVVSFLENTTLSIRDHNSTTVFANVTDDMGNSVTGGNLSFVITDSLSGESAVIGTSKVIEGIALLVYGENLDFGSYVLSGSYEYAIEPVLTKTGNILAVLSTRMHLNIDENLSGDIDLGNSFTFELVLIDSNDTYLADVPVNLYKNGVYAAALTTDDFGFLSFNVECTSIGKQEYYLVYNGDLIHDKAIANFTFNVVYNPKIDFRNSSLVSYYPIIIASGGDAISFELYFEDSENQTPLAHISTTRYFLVYKDGELMDYRRDMDYDGIFYGTKLIYYVEKGANVYKIHDSGYSYLFVDENSTGIHVFEVKFNGGHVIGYQFDSTNGVVTTHDYGYYYPNNLSVILIISDEDATINTNMDVNGPLNISNVDYANYSIRLYDSDNNSLADREVFLYDYGVLIDSAFTDDEGKASFTLNDYLDTGSHLMEFVYSGDSEYLPVYNAFFVDVYENPNKDNLTFENASSLNLKGPGNEFVGVLKDKDGNGIANASVNVEILSVLALNSDSDTSQLEEGSSDSDLNSLGEDGSVSDLSPFEDNTLNSNINFEEGISVSNAFSLRNYTVITDENGSFSIPLELGAGNYIINCSYNGNRFYNNLSTLFSLNISKISTNLYGYSQFEVLGEDSYLTYVLTDEFFNPLNNTRIKIGVYSDDLNTSYYAFTNESGASRFKVALAAGNYYLIASYGGDNWYAPSGDVLTNLTVYGGQSYLKVNETIFIIESGLYNVRLVDDNDNPITGEEILITVSNQTYSRFTDDDGIASLNINLDKGTYQITAKYMGKVGYKSSQSSSIIYVVDKDYKFPSFLKANSSYTFRAAGNYTVYLTDIFNNPLANQPLSVFINDSSFEISTDENGTAILEISMYKGAYIIKTVFNGNENYQNSSVKSDLVIVDGNATSSILECPVYSVYKGNDSVFTVRLRDKLDNPLVSKKLNLFLNGTEYTKYTDNQGRAYLNIDLPSGSYQILCKFLGDNDYFASECEGRIVVIRNDTNSTVHNGSSISDNGTQNKTNSSSSAIKKSTKILTGSTVKYYKDSKKIAIYLKDSNGKAVIGRYLSLKINGKTYKASTDKNGRINLLLNFAKGSYKISIKFAGDKYYKASSKTVTVKVVVPIIKAKKTAVKRNGKLQIVFKNYKGGLIKNQKVFIKLKGKTYTVKTNGKGIASLKIGLKKGTYTVSTGLKNTKTYGKYTKSFKIKVM